MISPDAIERQAKKREEKNLRFRTWLKIHADEDELDNRFKALHEKLFAGYDCCRCANCCKEYHTTVQPEEIGPIAAYLGLTVPDFAATYLSSAETGYVFPAPCPMLQEDGKCRIQECKPEECKGFPYTDRLGRMESLYGVMEYAGICLVVYEIVERLKQMYGFR